MYRFIILIVLFISIQTKAQVFDMLVDRNTPGAYITINNAIGRIPATGEKRYLIYIANGVYNEKLILAKKNVGLIGESVDGVIITNGDHANDGTHGTSDSYTFWVNADDFYCENITIVNSAGNVGQAVALRTDGDRQVFKNCKFIGFQDTYYVHSGIQYHLDCTIEGATDFIFGDATSVFDNCTINCVSGGQYITAPADSKLLSTRDNGSTQIHGILFTNSYIKAGTGVSDNSYYLGRPWQPNSSSVFMHCTLGSHIKTVGWSTWSDDNHLSSYFAEYKNVDEQGLLVDTSGRANWSYQIPDSIAEKYYNLDYFLEKESIKWDPKPITEALDAPAGLTSVGDYNLTWNNVDGALGYVIIRNDSTVGFSETNDYIDSVALSSKANTYVVKSVNTNGNLSSGSDAYFVAANSIENTFNEKALFRFSVADRAVYSNVHLDFRIFSLSGKLLLNKLNTNHISLNNLENGIYIISAQCNSGKINTQKIVLK
jgi:pectin methylesterase-like acyl-CoA thioesterase